MLRTRLLTATAAVALFAAGSAFAQTAPMAYTSDIPLLGNWGKPLLFGPGSIHVAHTPDEYIEESELRASVDAYITLVQQLLA